MAEQQPLRLGRRWVWWVSACLAALVCLSPVGAQAAQGRQAGKLFPLPKSLKPNVDFWIRVFTELEFNTGVLHDPNDLRIIYQTLYNLPRNKNRRKNVIKRKRNYYKGILERLARGERHALTRDERRVLSMFRGKQTAEAFRRAARRVRFQTGMREGFKKSLVRSGAYLSEIQPIFDRLGLPKELTMLPHIESSFSNKAHSKYGAMGLWQLMPATGRRFLTVNRTVDERRDVRLATIAAGKLLKDNYRLLGTWPLAITAYNHGAGGMRRAVKKTGTKNIGTIVRRYRGRSFGFASRNFYAEFLAAVHVAKHYRHYFGAIQFAKPQSQYAPRRYRVQHGDSLGRIAARFNTTVKTLVALNDLQQRNLIRVGQVLHIPATHRNYRVRQGDSLARIAQRFGTTVGALTAINDVEQPHLIKAGQVLRVPAGRMTAERMPVGRTTAVPAIYQQAQPQAWQPYRVRQGDSLGHIAKRFNTTVAALAATNDLEHQHLIRVGQVLRIPATHHDYRVQQGDSLARIAQRFNTTVADLITLNDVDQPHLIKPGQALRVPAGRTAAAPAVHESVQPQKPQRYRVQPGDSLSVIAARFNTTVATLAMVNGLSKPYLIKPGQVLDVAQSMPLRRYQVRQGDTLGRVAKRFRTTVAMLAALNGLRKPYLIKTGQTLVIPQLRSQHPGDSTVVGKGPPDEDMRTGVRVPAA